MYTYAYIYIHTYDIEPVFRLYTNFHKLDFPQLLATQRNIQVAIPSELSLDDLCHFLGHREGLEAVRVVFRTWAQRVMWWLSGD